MSKEDLRTRDLAETGKTAEVRQPLSGSLVHWLELSANSNLEAAVTPEYYKDFLEDTLP